MVSHPELGSDPPIGLDRESGSDTTTNGDHHKLIHMHFIYLYKFI